MKRRGPYREGTHDERVARFKRLCWPHLGMMLRMARHLACDAALAEDLVQDSMLKALRSLDSFEEGTNVKAWLMTILRRTHIDWMRSQDHRRGDTSIEAADVSTIEAPHEASADDGVLEGRLENPDLILEQIGDQTLIECLRRLPDEMRWTVLLVDVEQIDHASAAEILAIPLGTVKSRAHRGRAMLRRWLLDPNSAGSAPGPSVEAARTSESAPQR